MGAGNGTEDRDQHDQNGAGRHGVAEKGERHILGQRLAP